MCIKPTIQYWYITKTIRLLLFILVACIASTASCLEQQEKFWPAVYFERPVTNNNWRTSLYSQFRFINESHPLQAVLVEAGLGYQLLTDDLIWIGYRWTGHHPWNYFFQENRLFQQYIFQRRPSTTYRLINRTRLEEIQRGNESEIALRLRQRLSIEWNRPLFTAALPLVYDEIFFQLNHPSYEPRTFIGQNRLFLGVNLRQSEHFVWEIGYINQYQIRTPQQTENIMSHIISITFISV